MRRTLVCCRTGDALMTSSSRAGCRCCMTKHAVTWPSLPRPPRLLSASARCDVQNYHRSPPRHQRQSWPANPYQLHTLTIQQAISNSVSKFSLRTWIVHQTLYIENWECRSMIAIIDAKLSFLTLVRNRTQTATSKGKMCYSTLSTNEKYGSTIEFFQQRPMRLLTVAGPDNLRHNQLLLLLLLWVTSAMRRTRYCINLTPRTKHPIIPSLTDKAPSSLRLSELDAEATASVIGRRALTGIDLLQSPDTTQVRHDTGAFID